MKILPQETLSVKCIGENILALLKDDEGFSLSLLSAQGEVIDEMGKISDLKSDRGRILLVDGSRILLGIENKLLSFHGGKFDVISVAHHPFNYFWHATELNGKIYVQEYGESPTDILGVTDKVNSLATNLQIDQTSRHFHAIAGDKKSGTLFATLGDGNAVRVAVSSDDGESWSPLYKGSWQFVPILPLDNRILFGFDSGISRGGGVGVLDMKNRKWNFILLRWAQYGYDGLCQFADLKRFQSTYVGSLGVPKAFVLSKDLCTWHLIHLECYNGHFDHSMTIEIGTRAAALCTGSRTYVFTAEELQEIAQSDSNVCLSVTRGYESRMIGMGSQLLRHARKYRIYKQSWARV